MTLNDILILGDPRLYQKSAEVTRRELPGLIPAIGSMHDLIRQFSATYGKGRAIAAPQIGIFKRVVCYRAEQPVTLINPEISDTSGEMMELWDDCMSFPQLLVRVRRHRKCTLTFRDPDWKVHQWRLENDLSELFQHEVDHLNGILATDRAIDQRSFKMVSFTFLHH